MRIKIAVSVLMLVLASACTQRPRRMGLLPPPVETYSVGPGDRFELMVVGEPTFPKEYTVAPDGSVDFPWIHRKIVAGLEPQQISDLVGSSLAEGKFLKSPTVIVNIKELNSKRITVGGQVVKPGEIPYTSGVTLYGAILRCGGFAPLANRTNVLVTRKTQTGQVTVSVSVEDISEGRIADVPLQAGDGIFVYEVNF
ncbi:MAG: polysaccharide biosynthesis/export family protein [Polyangiaceae bacterium]